MLVICTLTTNVSPMRLWMRWSLKLFACKLVMALDLWITLKLLGKWMMMLCLVCHVMLYYYLKYRVPLSTWPSSSFRGYIISHSKTWAPKGFSFLQRLEEKLKGKKSAIGKPLEAISRNSDLGRCWAMDGSVGYDLYAFLTCTNNLYLV